MCHYWVFTINVPLFLTDARMDCNAGEVAFAKQLIKFGRTQRALDEDDDLVELKLIKQLVELTVLLLFIQLDVVLLQTVESQLGLIVDVNLERVLHEFLADWSDILG